MERAENLNRDLFSQTISFLYDTTLNKPVPYHSFVLYHTHSHLSIFFVSVTTATTTVVSEKETEAEIGGKQHGIRGKHGIGGKHDTGSEQPESQISPTERRWKTSQQREFENNSGKLINSRSITKIDKLEIEKLTNFDKQTNSEKSRKPAKTKSSRSKKSSVSSDSSRTSSHRQIQGMPSMHKIIS